MNTKDFIRPVGTILLSGIMAQSMNILGVFLLAMYLTPEVFGQYSVFLAYATIFLAVSLLSFEKTLPNVSDNELANFILGLTVALTVFLIFSYLILSLIDYEYALHVMFYVTLGSGLKVAQMGAIRTKNFNIISYLQITPSFFFVIMIFVANKFFIINLNLTIVILCISNLPVVLFLFKVRQGFPDRNESYSFKKSTLILFREKEFALFTAPSEVFNRLAYYLPTLIISNYFGATLAGQYSLMLRICFAPISLLTRAVGYVFQSNLAFAVREKGGHDRVFTTSFVVKLIVLVILTTLGIYFILPELVLLIFGDGWEETYKYIKIMAPLFSLMAVVAPLSVAFHVHRKNRELMVQQGIYLAISLVSFGCAVYFGDLLVGIVMFSLFSSVRYIHMLFVLRKII